MPNDTVLSESHPELYEWLTTVRDATAKVDKLALGVVTAIIPADGSLWLISLEPTGSKIQEMPAELVSQKSAEAVREMLGKLREVL